jgi:hypothetical protein
VDGHGLERSWPVGRSTTMSEKARQQLEEHLRRLEQQRRETQRKLRALVRQTQHELRYRCGELVELAGLAHLDPGTLLGGLCALADLLTDVDTAARWKTVGEVRLAAYRQRKARRKRPPLSGTDGISWGMAPEENDISQEQSCP